MMKSFQRCPYEKALLYILFKKFQNNQVTTMISYATFIYSGNFHKLLTDSFCFQNLPKGSVGMGKKILGNLGLFSETSMTIHF